MMNPIAKIDFSDYTESIPAFMTIIRMFFAYSIANEISYGMISFVLFKILGNRREEISPLMYTGFHLYYSNGMAPFKNMESLMELGYSLRECFFINEIIIFNKIKRSSIKEKE